MNKLLYEALSKIPKRFIDNDTQHTDWWDGLENMIIIANPKYTPMVYKNNKWSILKFPKRMTATEVITNNMSGFAYKKKGKKCH